MRIAYLGCKGLPSQSGTERVVEAITSRLTGKHEITVYCDSRYTPKGTKIDGIRLLRIPTLKGKHSQATSLFLLSAFHALLSRYDVIHLNGIEAGFVLPILRLRHRIVSTSHGTATRHGRLKWGTVTKSLVGLMEYPFVYLSDYATSVSLDDVDYLRTRYKRDVLYIPNGVDGCIQFDLERARSKLLQAGLEPGDYLMFAAGRIDPTKGCHVLLKALNIMQDPPKLAIVGDLNQVPSYGDHLRAMADGERVVFVPPIADRELLFGMLKHARLFVFPSTTEAMSMMLLEAASLQAPIICSDIPENRIAMHDHVLYFHSGDPVDLADKLQWALSHPGEMSNLGRKASTFVRDNRTWEKTVERYEEIYRACANGNR